MTTNYEWVDDPTMAGVSAYNPDVLNECLMHLKYDIPSSYDSKIENCSTKNLSNVTTDGKDTAVSWGMPDFSTTVDIPTTLDLVQCCDKDCYLSLFSYRAGYGFIQICDVEGNAIYTNLSEANYHFGGGTVTGTGFAIMTPLLPKGTYFKFVQNSGLSSAKKIYKRG